jgi:hypothetical protein
MSGRVVIPTNDLPQKDRRNSEDMPNLKGKTSPKNYSKQVIVSAKKEDKPQKDLRGVEEYADLPDLAE